MGVPALFRWLSQKYPKIISPVIEEQPREVDGVEIPPDTRGVNPNGEEFDNLYLDMNGIVHPCSHPEDKPAPANEEEMMIEIFKYTERVVNMVRPRKLLMIAVDGVAPRAKMNQQRSRRFRSAQEAKQKDEEKLEFLELLKQQHGGQVPEDVVASIHKKTWDSNAITPGTPFMDILAASLRYWIAYKLNTDPAWAKLKIIISDATVPGEGEHKIMEFIRSQRRQQDHDPNTRHVIYGLDADLIMLGLATHEPHFRVLREDVFFQEKKARTCKICNQTGHMAAECRGEAKKKEGEFDEKSNGMVQKPFIWLHVSILREYLKAELEVPNQGFKFDLERALDDWVFMCFFVGNDFLPHLPSLDIREQGIDTLIAIWRDNLPAMGGYVTKDGIVDLDRVQLILQGLAKQEDTIFRRRKENEDRRAAAEKRRNEEREARKRPRMSTDGNGNGTPGGRGRVRGKPGVPTIDQINTFNPADYGERRAALTMTHDEFVNRTTVIEQANVANKSAAAVLREKLLRKSVSTPELPTANGSEGQASADEPAKEETALLDEDSAPPTPELNNPAVALGKRKAELIEEGTATPSESQSQDQTETEEDPNADTVRLWEDGYADRYYEQKFKVDPKDIEFRHKVGNDYVEGLCWVLRYYFQGCPSWTWYYPHHYAPFAADFVNIGKLDITFEQGKPFRPYEQLMGVLPAASNHAIPEAFHELMTHEDSEILDFYPEDFPIDLNGKKWAWQGVALLPFIDEKRLLAAMEKKYPLLSEDEHRRNSFGYEVLMFSSHHPLYEDATKQLYGKNGATEHELDARISEGLLGKVEKCDDYLPDSALRFPLPTGGMPDLDIDHSMSVNYKMPHSDHLHKSMLLRGVVFPPPALDHSDIAMTRSRAGKTGRGFGGAPFRDNRGGRFNYSSDRNRGLGQGQGQGQSRDDTYIPNYGRDRQYGAQGNNDYSRRDRDRGRDNYRNQPPSSYSGGYGQQGGYSQGYGNSQGGPSLPLNPNNPFAALMDPRFMGQVPPPHIAAQQGWVPPVAPPSGGGYNQGYGQNGYQGGGRGGGYQGGGGYGGRNDRRDDRRDNRRDDQYRPRQGDGGRGGYGGGGRGRGGGGGYGRY